MVLFTCLQVVAVILGLVYLRLKLDQEGVGDFNGAIFIILANISFTASVGALYVSLLPSTGVPLYYNKFTVDRDYCSLFNWCIILNIAFSIKVRLFVCMCFETPIVNCTPIPLYLC